MSSGAIAQLMGFITVPDFRKLDNDNSLLKFRLAFNRFDFGLKKSVTDFITVTAFGKMADRIYSDIQNNLNYICCFCDVRVSKYISKTGSQAEHTEFIINDFRAFHKPKSESAIIDNADNTNKSEFGNGHSKNQQSINANTENPSNQRVKQKAFVGFSDDLHY